MFNKIKNKISFIMFLVLSFQLILSINYPNTIAQAATLPNISYAIVGDTTVGKEFTINVNISNIANLYGDSFEFKFDPTLIQVTGISNGNVFDGQVPQIPNKTIDNVNGSVLFTSVLIGDKPGVTASSKTLFALKVKSLKAGNLSLNTALDNSVLSLVNSARVKLANASGDVISYTSTKLDVAMKNFVASPLTVGKYEETNPNIKFVGTWNKSSNAAFSGGACSYSSTSGNYISFSFTGTGFKWVQPVSSIKGIAKVTIDGIAQNVDAFSATYILNKIVLNKSGLTSGTHTVKIEVTSNKNASATGITQAFDYVEILDEKAALTIGKYEESNPNINFVGTWKKSSNTAFSGGACVSSATPGNYISFSFTGTGFKWVQPVSSIKGIAKVTIDGIAQNVDTFSATYILNKVVLNKSGLTSGTHTVKIEVTSNKNSSATGIAQAFDYVEILDEKAALTIGKYEESNPNINFVGTWNKSSNTAFSGGACVSSTTPGNYISFSFTGTGFKWVQPVSSSKGIAKVTVDGIAQNVDAFSATYILNKVVLNKSGLTSGTHTVKIEVTSNKNSSATGIAQAFDYVEILDEKAALTIGKYEESNPNINFVGTWKKSSNTAFSGGACVSSATPGNYISFSFTGTGFKWVQPVSSVKGIAKVTIDGIAQNVDAFSATYILNKVVLNKSGLTFGTHTVKIEVTSNKNASATGITQAFDYVEILK